MTPLSVAVTRIAVVAAIVSGPSRITRESVCVAFTAVRDSDDLSMNSNSFAQQSAGISPALLNPFQNPHQQQPKPFTGSHNPHLMNAGEVVQQLGGSVNLAALQQPPAFNLSQLLNAFNLSKDQFQALSPKEKQMLSQRYLYLVSLPQNQSVQSQVGQQVPYERPSSSASNQGPHQNSMLPPPPPRPPTAQGAPQISRPGTSLSHRSPTIPGSGPTNLNPMMERPQSGLVRFSFFLSLRHFTCTFLRRLNPMPSSSKAKISPHNHTLNSLPFQPPPA